MILKKLMNTQGPLLYLLSIPLLHTFYELLNKFRTGATNIAITIDHKIPFIPEFVIPYIGWYIFIFFYLIYFFQKDKKIYYKSLISMNIGMIISYIIYFFFQTTFPRPVLEGNDVYTNLVRFIYANDQPYNCFPSIHVLTTFIIMYGMFKSEINSRAHAYTIYFLGTLIIMSTVFVKQHSILDGIASIVLVHFIFKVVTALKLAELLDSVTKKWTAKEIVPEKLSS